MKAIVSANLRMETVTVGTAREKIELLSQHSRSWQRYLKSRETILNAASNVRSPVCVARCCISRVPASA